MNVDTRQSTSVLSTNSFRSLDLSSKYMGLIQLSPYKVARNNLFSIFDYITSTAPPLFWLHNFIGTWRIVQFIGPSLCSRFYNIWGEKTVMYFLMDILSVTSFIVPSSLHNIVAAPMMLAIAAFFIICLIFIQISSMYYAKEAKLPKVVSCLISIFFGTVGYIFPPITTQLAAETIGRMIANPSQNVDALNVVSVVITVIVNVFYLWLFSSIYSVTIIFRPDSLQTVMPSVQRNVFILQLLITFVMGIAPEIHEIATSVLMGVTAILYLVSLFIMNMKGGLISNFYRKSLISSAVSGFICQIIAMFFNIFHIPGTEIVILIIIAVWGVSFFSCSYFIGIGTNRSLSLLDEIEHDESNFELVRHENTYASLLIEGFRYSHPLCISWTFLKRGVERWPKSVGCWLAFAKFIAIYPEETPQLEWVSIGIINNKIKGSLAKHTLQQMQTLARQRESALIPQMKNRLDKINKTVQSTKHKVRYIWDLIIQGNVRELESVVARAYKAIESLEAEYQHLLRMFPNSRFVARSYARFLKDVVGDFAGYKQWAANLTLLSRGVSVFPDQAHDLGLRAFPNLPKNVISNSIKNISSINVGALVSEETLTTDFDGDDETALMDSELRLSVKSSIDRLVIPSYRRAKILRFIVLVILFTIPVIVLSSLIPTIISDNAKPLNFMTLISEIRTCIFQIAGLSLHLVSENTPSLKLGRIDDFGDKMPTRFGNTTDTREMLTFIANKLSENVHQLSGILAFEQGQGVMENIRDILFTDILPFTSKADDNGEVQSKNMSGQAALTKLGVVTQNLLAHETINQSFFRGNEIFTIFSNVEVLNSYMSKTLVLFRQYVDEANDSIKQIIYIAMICLIVIVVVLDVFACWYVISRINTEKMMIYKCIASLPKHIVSKVADAFKVLKKEEEENGTVRSRSREEELNKQEENVLKIFSMSSDTHDSSNKDTFSMIFCTVFEMLIHIGCTVLLTMYLLESGKELVENAPHIDYLMGSYSFDFASVVILNLAALNFDHIEVEGFPLERILKKIYPWQSQGTENYDAVRFGDPSKNVNAFSIISGEMLQGTVSEECNKEQTNPTTFHEAYECWSPDFLTAYVKIQLAQLIDNYNNDNSKIFHISDQEIRHIWHIHVFHLFENLYAPLFDIIVSTLISDLTSTLPGIIGITFGLLIVAWIIESALFVVLVRSEARQKFALRLLLHVPGQVVLSNSHITQLLSGDFSDKLIDTTNRDSEFYDQLVKNMPDAVIIADLQGTIQTANNAVSRILKTDENLIGKNLIEFGRMFDSNDNPFLCINEKPLNSSYNFMRPLSFKTEEKEYYVEVSFSVLTDQLVVTVRDETQTVMYNKLIFDEKTKSDKMLASILPPKLVPRVQAGEKNISFAVQSVTVLFLDIVSFTPWCGSNSAQFVMSTLNRLFKELDQLVALYPTITKIKCIGDCYMCAGGIFAEVNTPTEHAKEVVEFGLDAIEAVTKINGELGTSLQIRVGINTGGPIVAGVLGTEKPTFEILGPAINLAQQMEHHGVQMKVHVSRAVYELIYGGNYDVKERGEVETKKGKMLTYLIGRH